jgi:putative nucleotidyltransferase with HDIG domain
MLLGNVSKGVDAAKTLFNVSQIALSVLIAATCYQVLGGQLPPAYLGQGSVLAGINVQRDLGLFFVLAALYFVVNSVAVSIALAIISERAFREVWNLNVRGVLGYDLGASILAVLMAWLYTSLDHWLGFGSLAVILLIAPIVAVRHVYGLYRQLQESGEELLELMVKAIEARDPYTSGHSVRVSKLSRTIAVELGLPAAAIEQIETAALLHDVGKIHEEFAPLLRKESKLTDAETALMQTHAAKSADLVAIITKFRGVVVDSVRHHHERWDGDGYPSGIGGTTIPMGARIILVSDTIDAMTTDRPYRKRLSVEAVLMELQKYKGTQFDPTIVELVVSSVNIRRLISEPFSASAYPEIPSMRSKRVSWSASKLWPARQA